MRCKIKVMNNQLKNLTLLLFLIIIGQSLSSCDNSEEEGDPAFVESVIVEGADITEGQTRQMTVTVLPENAMNKSVSWSSSDLDVATVSSSGLVTALKNGTVTISAIAEDRATVSGNKELVISSFDESGELPPSVEVSTVEELRTALYAAEPGDVILIHGGNYEINSRMTLSNDGSEGNPIVLIADPDESRPRLDFSAMSESSSNQGIVLEADFWHIKGIDFYKEGDNGLQIKGSNNLIEFCTFSECADTGLQIDNGAANNTIFNCDSFFNADSSVENADGFACKLTAGTGNTFIGCRAWNNLDDGWDGYLRGSDDITTTYENCWAIRNGLMKDGNVGGGDGNGFKTGGSDDKQLKHNAIYTNCLAIENVFDGFDHNSNRGAVTIYNCASYGNGTNYNFSNTNPLGQLTIKNSLVIGSLGATNASSKDISNNSWNGIASVSEADFQSIEVDQLLGARQADGSLPIITFMHLVEGSDLIDKGVDVGLDFNGSAPDLGAFEFGN